MTSLPYPPYSCTTGNCTWDPFPNLGVTVQCCDNSADYSLNYSEAVSDIWPEHPFRPCTIANIHTGVSALPTEYPPPPLELASPTLVFSSDTSYQRWSPDEHFGSNYTLANGFPEEWRHNWTSIHAGFAKFK